MRGIEQYWYEENRVAKALRPLSWLFCLLVLLRRLLYLFGILRRYRVEVPVIVVGNITVGGTGKTPMVIWLAKMLKEAGYRPGIISRGYGGKAKHWPQQVRPDSDPYVVGDEAVMIARHVDCPMAVGPDRVTTARALCEFTDCNVIISDDGMQHYRLRRQLEIAVIDGERRFGNGWCLPAGPLRERISRIKRVDFVVANGKAEKGEHLMQLEGGDLINLDNDTHQTLSSLAGQRVHAIAGIGNPQRFYQLLKQQGLEIEPHDFGDHHRYRQADLAFDDGTPLLMTEKDAVKLRRFAKSHYWYYPVEAQLPKALKAGILSKLKGLENG